MAGERCNSEGEQHLEVFDCRGSRGRQWRAALDLSPTSIGDDRLQLEGGGILSQPTDSKQSAGEDTVAGGRIGLALSGGGSRAAAFHRGTLRALDEIGLLRRIDVVSTVSGGSLFGAAWLAARARGESDEAFLAKMGKELQRGFVRRSIRPLGLLKGSFGVWLLSGRILDQLMLVMNDNPNRRSSGSTCCMADPRLLRRLLGLTPCEVIAGSRRVKTTVRRKRKDCGRSAGEGTRKRDRLLQNAGKARDRLVNPCFILGLR